MVLLEWTSLPFAVTSKLPVVPGSPAAVTDTCLGADGDRRSTEDAAFKVERSDGACAGVTGTLATAEVTQLHCTRSIVDGRTSNLYFPLPHSPIAQHAFPTRNI